MGYLVNCLFDDRLLLDMATSNPAKLVHLENRLGALKEGYLADVLVLEPSDGKSNFDPYSTMTHSVPEDVLLVFVDGKAVHGNPAKMNKLVNSADLESMSMCDVEKRISFAS